MTHGLTCIRSVILTVVNEQLESHKAIAMAVDAAVLEQMRFDDQV